MYPENRIVTSNRLQSPSGKSNRGTSRQASQTTRSPSTPRMKAINNGTNSSTRSANEVVASGPKMISKIASICHQTRTQRLSIPFKTLGFKTPVARKAIPSNKAMTNVYKPPVRQTAEERRNDDDDTDDKQASRPSSGTAPAKSSVSRGFFGRVKNCFPPDTAIPDPFPNPQCFFTEDDRCQRKTDQTLQGRNQDRKNGRFKIKPAFSACS